MAATYPTDDLDRALGSIEWELVEVHQTANGQHQVAGIDKEDVTIEQGDVTRVIVDCDRDQTMLLGKFKTHLENALGETTADEGSAARVMPEGNEFRVFSVNGGSRPSGRVTQY